MEIDRRYFDRDTSTIQDALYLGNIAVYWADRHEPIEDET